MCCKTYGTAAAMTLAAILGSDVAAEAQGRGNASMRFAGMDTNGDHQITRDEWRGSQVSFQRHDWNGDGKLSGPELRPGRRQAAQPDPPFDSPYREYELPEWSAQTFNNLDHNRDRRLTADEWHFDRESFRRADHNRDGVLSRAEFLAEGDEDDDVEDRFRDIDVNGDGRIVREEWHASRSRFDALDDNRDGVLTRAEVVGDEPPRDLFVSLDVNKDGAIARQEWHWAGRIFAERDVNRDGVLSREEFFQTPASRSNAYRTGYDRGLIEGRAAGREEFERRQPWDLEGQSELEAADSGYEPRLGSREEYQAGYRDGFRRAYREGWEAARKP